MALNVLYRDSLALLTDLYELTMACGYWKAGVLDKEAAFSLHFREHPFNGGFTVACGLQYVIEYLQDFHFAEDDLTYLATVTGSDGQPLFPPEFLDYLHELRLECDVDAVPEGTVVFPHEPLVRVRGPLLQAQILETALLNMVNFQTLIATKAARVCLAARGEPVIEFGLRRAQGIDGGVTVARAAYVGGCTSTSNVLAGKLFGIPVKGTHAHSWVMSFDSEMESFIAWAEAMPNNSIFLVDTYNSLEGTRHAVEAGKLLRARGYKLAGIRLDSGDLAYLSIEARKILDEGGFPDAAILGSGDLDEHVIDSLKEQGATIALWGVGTRLATAYDQPALGGIYKLTAVRESGGPWQPKIKLSEQVEKINTPGMLQVLRYYDENGFVADMIYDEETGVTDLWLVIDPADPIRRKHIPEGTPHEPLLAPIFRAGNLVYESPSLDESRARTQDQLDQLHAGTKRLLNPHEYPAGLEVGLYELKNRLILELRA